MFNFLRRKIKAMCEPKLVDEATVQSCMAWDLDEIQFLATALGYDQERQKQLYAELFRSVSAERWAAVQRTIARARARSVNPDAGAVLREIERSGILPPAKSLKELERAARAWHAADKWPSAFLDTVSADICEHEPPPGPGYEWLRSGLQAIACGAATSLGPRPAAPPPVSAEEFHRQGEAAHRFARENRDRIAENIRAGRGLLDAPAPEAVTK